MKGDLSQYDRYTRSLRETLQPMTRFIQQSIMIEVCGDSLMRAARTLTFPTDIDPDMWFMLPYPYDRPIYFDLVAEKKRQGDSRSWVQILNELDGDDLNNWKDQFYKRVSPLLDHALHDTTVGELDADPATGLLLSISTGVVRQFSYDIVDGIELTVTPVAVQRLLPHIRGDYLQSILGADGYQYYCNSLKVSQGYFEVDARLTGYNKDVDTVYRRDHSNWIHFTDQHVISLAGVGRVSRYLTSMIKNRAKCIIIP